MDLRKIMFQNVYDHPEAKKKKQKKAIKMLKKLYTYYIENPDEMSAEYRQLRKKENRRHKWSAIIWPV